MSISNKERFKAIARFERPGDLCLLTPIINVFWNETLDLWAQDGAPEQIRNTRFYAEYFQFTHLRLMHEIQTGLDFDRQTDLGNGLIYEYPSPPIIPGFESKVISEDQHTITVINEVGQTARVFKNDPQKMPMYLDHPVKDRASWEEYKKRLDPFTPERYPADWDGYVKKINSKDEPIWLLSGSFFGFLREWMGLERLLYTFYDDPVLVEDMMEQMCYMEIEAIKRVTKDIRVDCAFFWEDMAFKTGPLISPDMFRKFMLPRYKRVTETLRSNGIDIIFVDSDGNVDELIPLWMEGGVNFIWPLERAAGNDAIAIRKKYGKNLTIAGNMDKRALLKGKEAIREEVMSKLPFLLEQGGYFPSIDHAVPPDVTFENFVYYINTMREVAGLEKLPT